MALLLAVCHMNCVQTCKILLNNAIKKFHARESPVWACPCSKDLLYYALFTL